MARKGRGNWQHDEHGKPSSTRLLTFVLTGLLCVVAIADVFWDKNIQGEPYGVLQTLLTILVTAMTARGVAATFKGDPPLK
jgi:hypothetical protein